MKTNRVAASLTALVLTKDEAPNIGRCLERLRWVPRVLVVDSFSSDETVAVARSFPNTEVRQRVFDSFAGQCNSALDGLESEWVLSLDADYILPDGLVAEMCHLPTDQADGYRAGFRYCIGGRPLRGSLYPPRTVLYRRKRARYRDSGHGHVVVVDGKVADLKGRIDHDDRKPLERWLANQRSYARKEADHLLGPDRGDFRLMDRLRLMMIPAPFVAAAYVLIAKGCILDGVAGWHYTAQRVLAEVLISLELADRRLQARIPRAGGENP